MCIRWLPLVLLCIAGAHGAELKRDCYGDPLPEGAIARLGSLCLRNDELISTAAFTADGKELVSAGGGSLSFWDPVTGKMARRLKLKNATHAMGRGHLSADGKTLIQKAVHDPAVLYVMDACSGAQQGVLKHGQGGIIRTLDVSRDGKVLAAVYRDMMAVFDVPHAKLLHEFKSPPAGPISPQDRIALTPDGKQLILPYADGSLHLVEVASGKELRAFKVPPLRPGLPSFPRIQRLGVSPDGRYLAFGGPATALTVCELATGKTLHELAPPKGIYYTGVAFTPNGRVLAVDEDRVIRLFDVSSGKEMCKLPVTGYGMCNLLFSPDGRTLAVVGGYTLKLWDMTAQRWLHPLIGHEGVVHLMAFFPDGKRLVCADYNNGMKVWDIASGQTLAQRTSTPPASPVVDGDGERVRFAGIDTSAHRWDPRTGRDEVGPRVVAGLLTNMLALSPDGRSLAVLIGDAGGAHPKRPVSYQMRLYDLKSNQFLTLPGPAPPRGGPPMLFSPDSRRLAARGPDSATRLWDRETGKLVREIKGEGRTSLAMHLTLAFAADGRSLLTWSGRLCICELASGAARLQIPAVAPALNGVAYAPDARFVACGHSDGRILVYSALSGKPLAQWRGDQGPIHSLAFSRDSCLLASGGANGTILIWTAPRDDSVPAVGTAEEAVSLWQALGNTDAAAANRALAGLAAAPAQALPLLRERLDPLGKQLYRTQYADLIAELDDDSFKVRERATRELALIGADAADALRLALNKSPSVEVKRRIEDLLARLKKGGYSSRLRFLRALEVLERLGTPQAKELLRELADKPISDELREEVQASLRRLDDKP